MAEKPKNQCVTNVVNKYSRQKGRKHCDDYHQFFDNHSLNHREFLPLHDNPRRSSFSYLQEKRACRKKLIPDYRRMRGHHRSPHSLEHGGCLYHRDHRSFDFFLSPLGNNELCSCCDFGHLRFYKVHHDSKNKRGRDSNRKLTGTRKNLLC